MSSGYPHEQLHYRPGVFLPNSVQQVNIGEKVGLICLNALVFFSFSRLMDMALGYLHVPLILGAVTAVVFLFQGGLIRAFSSNISRALGVFTVWALIGIPFSFWKSGSLTTLKDNWMKSLLVFLAIAGLINTYARLRTILFTLASAIVVATILLMIFGVTEDTRLALPGGELGNANQVALVMILGILLTALIVTDQTRFKPTRFVFALALLMMFRAMIRSGSRAALIASLAIFLMLLLEVSVVNKLKLLLGGAVLLLISSGFLTDALRARYSTLISEDMALGDDRTYDIQDSARRSSMSRRALLLRGVVMTAKNPIFGVGMGNFPSASGQVITSGRTDWAVSHNTYLQLSSETGIPGLILYGAAMLIAWFKTRSIRKRARGKPEWAGLANLALGVQVSLLGLYILMFFGSLAYDFYFPCFAGIAVSLEWCARDLMEKESLAQPAVAVQPLRVGAPVAPRRNKQPLPVSPV